MDSRMDSRQGTVKVAFVGSRSVDERQLVHGEMARAYRAAKRFNKKPVFVYGFESTSKGDRPLPGVGDLVFRILEEGTGEVDGVAVEVPWNQVERQQPFINERGQNEGRAPSPMYLFVEDLIEEGLDEAVLFSDGPDEWVQFAAQRMRMAGVRVQIVFTRRSRSSSRSVVQPKVRVAPAAQGRFMDRAWLPGQVEQVQPKRVQPSHAEIVARQLAARRGGEAGSRVMSAERSQQMRERIERQRASARKAF